MLFHFTPIGLLRAHNLAADLSVSVQLRPTMGLLLNLEYGESSSLRNVIQN
jgi:hypothetical protein